MKKRIILFVVLILATLRMAAVPAYPGYLTFTQPDGTTFRARVIGDEHFHYIISEDGYVLCRDAQSGYYCYAQPTDESRRVSSGLRYGLPASSEILSASRIRPRRPEAARKVRFNIPSRPSGRMLPASTRAELEQKGAVFIPVAFSDLSFKYSHQQISDLITKKGYNSFGATGSVADYFSDQLGAYYDFTFEVAPTVTVSQGYKYYGEDDEDGYDLHPDELVKEACRLADPDVDFSKYDHIFVIYAGGNTADGSADDDHIWPHMSNISLTLDGRRFTEYAMSSELIRSNSGGTQLSTIGTFCHEYSHTLGLPDFYDTDGDDSGGTSKGLWYKLELMDGGNYNNDGRTPPHYSAVDYATLGLGEQKPLEIGTRLKLEPIDKSHTYYYLNSANEGEFYLFEVRNNTGWDTYIGGRGMLIYHIDISANDSGYSAYLDRNVTASTRWTYNEVNNNPAHECARLIVPEEVNYVYSNYAGLFYGTASSRSTFGPDTDPSFQFWDGKKPVLTLTSISRLTSGNVQFNVSGPIILDNMETFQDGAIIRWHTSKDGIPMAVLCNGDSTVVSPNEGIYTYVADGLKPSTSYTANIRYGVEDDSPSMPVSFTTKTLYAESHPYIYMDSAEKTISGAIVSGSKIPLRVFNARSVAGVEWTMNGRPIEVGVDGYYELKESGELRAVVHHNNGSKDILVKEITLK
ncbi:MAG: M6 family metalloprotease domain-containing protein [Bacteroidales bacterium]|nr:M6 family metalloprotease domain-containing protein [Bacteroidales bacterium]